MADNIIDNQEVTQTQQPAVSAEVAEQMAISLNGGFAPEKQEEGQGNQGGNEQGQQQQVAADQPAFTFEPFKEKFGYEKPEDIFTEIESLRQLKAAPPVAEIKYENEQSKAIAEALQGGKTQDVYEFLDKQYKLDKLITAEVNKDTAADIIKLGMQLKYKDLTQSEIDHRFNKQFGFPKEPIKSDLEEETEFEEKHNEWKDKVAEIEMERNIEAKLAKPELETAKASLIIPKSDSAVDQNYLQYLKELEEDKVADVETKQAYKALSPKVVEAKMPFNDEANKIAFEFQYEPTAQEFSEAVEVVVEPDKFWGRYKNSDGSPNREKFLQDIHFILNKEKVIMEAMKQAKNATIKQVVLVDNSSRGIGERQIAQQNGEPSELDKQMRQALHGYM